MIRISTVVRLVEDGVVGTARAVKRTAKKFGHEYSVEYNARIIDKLQRRISIEAATLQAMSDAQRAKLAKDQGEVFARVEELRLARKAKAMRAYDRVSHV